MTATPPAATGLDDVTFVTQVQADSLLPVVLDAPPVDPTVQGLYAVTTWTDQDVPRWLDSGIVIRPMNFGGQDAFGTWDMPWCSEPPGSYEQQVKYGERPTIPEPHTAITLWAYDQTQCGRPDATAQAEARVRASQNMRLHEQNEVERAFADRLLTDVVPVVADDIVDAVAVLEEMFAATGTLGLIHARPGLAAVAAGDANVARGSGPLYRSPLGHTWVFGGGYIEGLANTLVATSPTFGFRTPAQVYESLDAEHNVFAVVAEKSVVVAYERAIGAVTIDAGSI